MKEKTQPSQGDKIKELLEQRVVKHKKDLEAEAKAEKPLPWPEEGTTRMIIPE